MWLRAASRKQLVVVALGLALSAGCSDGGDGKSCNEAIVPSELGPVITFFGLARADDRLIAPDGNEDGIPVYTRANGSGFRLVIEAKRGTSGAAVGQSAFDPNGGGFPDLQIEVSNDLGNGSSEVCDASQSNPGDGSEPGGVPKVEPACFDDDQAVIDAVNDLACRFVDGTGTPTARSVSSDSCVQFETGDYAFVHPESESQYCSLIDVPIAFPDGETVVTARVRDVDGNVGLEQQLIIRVES